MLLVQLALLYFPMPNQALHVREKQWSSFRLTAWAVCIKLEEQVGAGRDAFAFAGRWAWGVARWRAGDGEGGVGVVAAVDGCCEGAHGGGL